MCKKDSAFLKKAHSILPKRREELDFMQELHRAVGRTVHDKRNGMKAMESKPLPVIAKYQAGRARAQTITLVA